VTETLDAIRKLEAMVAQASGIALRYGSLYGPGTSLARDGEVVELVAARKFPIVGNGAGIWSFIDVEDAGVSMMTQARGSSNAKARREFGWRLRYPSWREGFRAGFVSELSFGSGDAALRV
jgi:hypothetical protein